jgi:hypothetical protein
MHAYRLFSLVYVFDAPRLFNLAVSHMIFSMPWGTLPVVLHVLVIDFNIDAWGSSTRRSYTLFLFRCPEALQPDGLIYCFCVDALGLFNPMVLYILFLMPQGSLSTQWSYTWSAKVSFNLGLTLNLYDLVSCLCSNHYTFTFRDHVFSTYFLIKHKQFNMSFSNW